MKSTFEFLYIIDISRVQNLNFLKDICIKKMWVHCISLSILVITYLNGCTCASIYVIQSISINEILQRLFDDASGEEKVSLEIWKPRRFFSSKSLLTDRYCIRFRRYIRSTTQNFSPRETQNVGATPLSCIGRFTYACTPN